MNTIMVARQPIARHSLKLSSIQLQAIFDALLDAKADAAAMEARQRSPEYAAAIKSMEIRILQQAFEKARTEKDLRRMEALMRKDAEAIALLLLPRQRGRPRGGQHHTPKPKDGVEVGNQHHSARARADRKLLRNVWPAVPGMPKFNATLADVTIEQFYLQVLKIQLPLGWQKQH